jgi:hypothetical protein
VPEAERTLGLKDEEQQLWMLWDLLPVSERQVGERRRTASTNEQATKDQPPKSRDPDLGQHRVLVVRRMLE